MHGPSNLTDKATVEEQRAIKECIANVLKRAVDDSNLLIGMLLREAGRLVSCMVALSSG